jgi:lipopolysaccharide heptosyltransferase II
MSAARDWGAARRILCIRLDSIGDVLMTTPAIRAVRESGDDHTVTLLTSSSGATIAPLIPCIDHVITYDAPWLKTPTRRETSDADHAMIRKLRAACFDAAIIFTVFSQSALPAALMSLLADIPLRLAHIRENPYNLLTTWVRDTEPESGIRHEVERQLSLVAQVGYQPSDTHLTLRVPCSAQRYAQALLSSVRIGAAAPWIVLHPGATAPSRRYPAAQFAAAVLPLVVREGYHVLVTGSAEEAALVRELCHRIGPNAIDLAGQLDITQLSALISAAPLLITNNTGPAHIAAAVGTPTVDIYALTNPQHTPWQVPARVLSHDVPCRNCFKSVCPLVHNNCIRGIPPSDVTRAALELLSEYRTGDDSATDDPAHVADRHSMAPLQQHPIQS